MFVEMYEGKELKKSLIIGLMFTAFSYVTDSLDFNPWSTPYER